MDHFKQGSMEEGVLSRYIDDSTDNLEPNRHYSLTLDRMRLPEPRIREFEQVFDRSLDRRIGRAGVVLHFSEETNAFYPQVVSAPLDRLDTKAVLYHTNSMGYIPTLSGDSAGSMFSMTQPTLSPDQLMDMLEIDQPPRPEGPAYRLWLSSLVDRSDAWGLSEKLEVPSEISDAHITTLILSNRTRIKRDGSESVRSIAREISSFTPQENILARVGIEKAMDGYFDRIHAYIQLGTQRPYDPYDSENNYEKPIALELNDDTFPDLFNLVSEAKDSRSAR